MPCNQTDFIFQSKDWLLYLNLKNKEQQRNDTAGAVYQYPWKLAKYYKQINIWAEEGAGKTSNIDFPSKHHVKTIFKSSANKEHFYYGNIFWGCSLIRRICSLPRIIDGKVHT